MKILSIDTSCDETAAAVTNGLKIVSNTIWSQASLHAKFGGVMPSLAQRMHKERIDFVIDKALKKAKTKIEEVDALAVTVGPGLSIALGVGIDKAKELAKKYNKPLFPINHIESHILSPLAISARSPKKNNISFPAYGLCVSGGNTIFVIIEKVGEYKILAETQDDALGEALDKAARMMGLGYPGGAILEKMAKQFDSSKNHIIFKLPIPLRGQEKRLMFSYSGLKTSLYRLIELNKKTSPDFPLSSDIVTLSSVFQDVAFKHITKVIEFYLTNSSAHYKNFLLGGGVSANIELRKRLRNLGAKFGFSLHIPYTNRLCGDNAAMIGITAFLKYNADKENLSKYFDYDKIDRNPRMKI